MPIYIQDRYMEMSVDLAVRVNVPWEVFKELCPNKAAGMLLAEWLNNKEDFKKFKEEWLANQNRG